MQRIAELIKQAKCRFDEGYLEVYSDSDSLNLLFELIGGFGYQDKKNIVKDDGGSYLSIGLNVDCWSGLAPFYRSIADVWQYTLARKKLPDYFVVVDGGAYSDQDPKDNTIRAIEYYLQWQKLLVSLKDHGGEGPSSPLVYFISTEKGAKVYELNANKIELSDVVDNYKGGGEEKDVEHLNEIIGLVDGHLKERRDVLRASLAELLDEDHTGSAITWLLKQGKKLRKKYQENYDVYLHKFSVNKLLSEIEEKSTDYISKINDSVSASQAKAFAIPGALIAIAALIKNADFFALFFVCAGLLSVTILTVIANNIHREAYGALREQVQRSLARYEVMKNEDAVRVSAEDAKKKLLSLIDKSVSRLSFIDYLSVAIFLMGVVYTLFSSSKVVDFFGALSSDVVRFFSGIVTSWLMCV